MERIYSKEEIMEKLNSDISEDEFKQIRLQINEMIDELNELQWLAYRKYFNKSHDGGERGDKRNG